MNGAVVRALGVLHDEGAVVEIRGFRGPSKVSGYFDDFPRAAREATRLDKDGYQVYVTLNAVDPALLARAANRIEKYPKASTADNDITQHLWLPLDFDPERPSGVSATKEEKEAAYQRAIEVKTYLDNQGWPTPVVGDSGNGYHLLYRIDLPCGKDGTNLVRGVLTALSFKFSDGVVKLDTGVYNPARIWKLYGTTARKGDDVPDRPHRASKLLKVRGEVDIVRRVDLEKVAAMQPSTPAQRPNSRADGFDLSAWIEEHGILVKREGPWNAGDHKWVLSECPWNGHADDAAYIVRLANGGISAGCHHNSCQAFGWREMREHYEPGVYEATGNAEPVAASTPTTPPSGIRRKLPEALPFPVDALPVGTRRFVAEAAAAIGCPPDLVAVPLLAALGAAVGASRVVELKRGWQEGATLYTAVVASPGTKKTPAAGAAIEQAWKRQNDLWSDYRARRKAYKNGRQERDRRGVGESDEPAHVEQEEPRLRRTVVEDTTSEALLAILEANPRGVLVAKDELNGWLRSMNQYRNGRGADRQVWLSMWSNSSVAVDRKGAEEPILISRPFVCITGSVQPAVLSDLSGGPDDGLLDRFLFAYPAPALIPLGDAEISNEADVELSRLYNGLSDLRPNEDAFGGPRPRIVKLSAEAWEVFKNLRNSLQEETLASGFPSRLEGAWSKLEAYLARLALIFALCRTTDSGGPESVEVSDLLRANELISYFKAHARRVHAKLYGDDPAATLEAGLYELLRDSGGSWEGTATGLLQTLVDRGVVGVPSRPDELSKMVRSFARQIDWLMLGEGAWRKEDDKSRRSLSLHLVAA